MTEGKKLRIPSPIVLANLIIGAFTGVIHAILHVWPLLFSLLLGTLIGFLVGWVLDRAFFRGITQPRKRIVTFLVFILIEPLLLFNFVAPAMAAYMEVHATHHPVYLQADVLAEGAVDVALITNDNLIISGWYAPSQNNIVIIALHGGNRNRLDILPQAKALVNNGFGVLLVDMRGHGNSGGKTYTSCLAKEDVTSAVRYIQEQEPEALIGAYGLSAGAHTSLCAAAVIEEIQAVFADGVTFGRIEDILFPRAQSFKPYNLLVPAYWTLSVSKDMFSGYREPPIQELVKEISPRPIYFLAAGNDILEPDQVHRYITFASPESSIWVAPGVSHGEAFAAYPEEYTRRMAEFFREVAHNVNEIE